ncbi:uncharacterized protein ARMOST_04712 [Armillaria ostoyae]|uniref:Uncharacterized protein n=1 Tax=Armillaria ostoyae TaxID=47428 RepID=A0A284QY43_ARMOS|nr:uncharacterized protein ARMOST_04712 [Armillaria ostoyae]
MLRKQTRLRIRVWRVATFVAGVSASYCLQKSWPRYLATNDKPIKNHACVIRVTPVAAHPLAIQHEVPMCLIALAAHGRQDNGLQCRRYDAATWFLLPSITL